MKTLRDGLMKKGWTLGVVALLGACATAPEQELPADLLEGEAAFVDVRKPEANEVVTAVHALGAPGGVSDGSDDFYLAIRKDVLEERWFLSAYMKQYHFGDAAVAAAQSLGTRVVSFRVQNDKLFVFDASDAFKASELLDPEVLLEAFPIVELESFKRVRGHNQYILVDPAAGLNRFMVTGELVADPNLADFGAFPLRVGLSYMQNFRGIADGATFEQVFTGDVDLGTGATTAWGTLGISLRAYQEGEGYTPTPDPGVPHYFMSDSRIIPDSGFVVEANPVRWNLVEGREPIQVAITAGAQRAQAAYPDHDVLGALERGIEQWNKVIGYEAFDAVFVDDDEIRDDDISQVLVDYPGAGNGFAFADWRHNPNNGEILGGSVYMGGVFFDIMPSFEDDLEDPETPVVEPVERPDSQYSFLWGGMPAKRPACQYWAPQYRSRAVESLRNETSLTATEKGERYIEHVITHEWGHVLGLRHNFKGSLTPPGGSVMDYTLDTDAVLIDDPGDYDFAAIAYLYQQSDELPTQAFCTDDDIALDPNCQVFDRGADPLREHWALEYDFLSFLVLDIGFPVDFLEFGGLLEILGFARDAGFVTPEDRLFALDLALGRSRVPLSELDAADPFIVDQANAMATFVFGRLVLDAPELRGAIAFDASDAGVLAATAEQAGRMLVNEDGVRSFELRRVTVDVLKRLQNDGAFLQLRNARDTVAGALVAGTVPTEDIPLTEDLLARMESALSPYFD
jgi:hypothetical protein